MAMYIYRPDGQPVGFQFGDCIHGLDGVPLGKILGTHVHRFDGSYVGELFKDSVVARPVAGVRSILPVAPPPPVPSPGAGFQRRGVVDYGYADVFDQLRDGPAAIAAE